MKPVFIIAIVAVTMIGIMGIGYMDSANAEMIRGENIPTGKPYGCLSFDIDTPKKQNEITITFSAYTRSPDISAVIQIDGQQQDEFVKKQQQNQIHKYFKVSEKNSHELQICLLKSWQGTDERELDITNVNWKLSKIDPPKTSTPNTHTPSTPIPDIAYSIDCTLKQKPQFDRYYDHESNWGISIVNPHPNNCEYEVKLYDSAKNYQGVVDKKLISSLGISFTGYSEGEYLISLKSMQNGKSYGYYPLTIGDKTTPIDLTSIDPTIILIVIAVAVIAIIAVGLSRRKKKEDEEDEEDEKPEPTNTIDVKEFLTACDYGDEDEFIRKFKSGKTEQECQKAFKRLLVDLMQQNAPPIVIMYVRTLIQGSKQDPTIPKRPDAPRLSNTIAQPLEVNVTWTAPNNGGSEIISYDLYRSATGKSKGFHPVERGIRGLTFTDILPSKGTWYYDVVATNSIGASPPSLAASITVGSGSYGGSGVTGYTKKQREAYKTLKISPGSSETEIKTAHRKLIILYHPDKAKSDSQREEFTAITKNVNLARSTLLKK